MRTVLLALLLVACKKVPSAAPTPMPEAFPEVRLGDDLVVTPLAVGVWVHTSTRDMGEWGRVPSNGLVVQRGRQVVVVDTAWDDEQTARLLAWVRTAVGEPTAVVATHAHQDKMGGIGAAREAGIPTFALVQSNAVAAERDLVPAEYALVLEEGEGAPLADGAVELYFPGAGHTDDNLVVWVPEARVLHGGCLIRGAASKDLGNTADGDVGAWDTSVERVQARFPDAAMVVPSHAPVGGPDLLAHTIELVHAHEE